MGELASLGGAALGGGVGFLIGGPFGAQVGLGVGAAVGGLFGGGKNQVIEGPRLRDLRVALADYGTPLLFGRGAFRYPGHVIWSSGKREIVNDQTESVGKGGGQEATTRTRFYVCDWQCAFVNSEMAPPIQIWFDAKLMYDVSAQASTATRNASLAWAGRHMAFYPGSETQGVDATIVAKEGAGNVNANLGLCHIVFRNHPLTDFGDRIPNVTAKLASATTPSNYIGCAEGGDDGALWLLPDMDYTPGRLVGNLTETYGFAWSLDKALIATAGRDASGGGVNTYTTSNWAKRPDPTHKPLGTARCCAFSPSGKYLVVGHDLSPYWRVYDPADMSIAVTPPDPGDGVDAVAFHPEETYIAVGTFKGSGGVVLGVYTLPGWDLVFPGPAEPQETVRAVAFSPDGETLAAGVGWGNALVLYDVATWGALGSPPDVPVNKPGYAVAFSPDGRWCALGHTDGTDHYLTVWETASSISNWTKQTLQGAALPHWGRGISFDATSSEMTVTGGTGGTGFLWRYSTGDWARLKDSDDIGVVDPLTVGYSPGYDVGRVAPGKLIHGEVIQDVAAKCGLEADDIDVGSLARTEHGFVYGAQTGRSAISNLALAGLFQGVMSQGKLKFAYLDSLETGITIDVEEMIQTDDGWPLRIEQPDEVELPRRLALTFPQVEKSYEQGEAHQTRLATISSKNEKTEIRAALTNQRAAELVDIQLYDAWAARRFFFVLPMKFYKLDLGDVITLTDRGEAYQVRLVSVQIENLSRLVCEAREYNAVIWSSAALGGQGPADTAEVAGIAATTLIMLDIPLFLASQNDARLYFGLAGQGKGWFGAQLYWSRDGGSSYTSLSQKGVSAVFGATDTLLASGITHTWDRVNTVDVTLDNPDHTLESVSELAVLNGANGCLIGAHGRWEVVQYATATLIGTGQYRLSNLLRGRRGTEHNVGNHTAADRFVVLSESLLGSQAVAIADINRARLYKGVTVGEDPAAVSGVAHTYTGVNLKPYSPVQAQGSRDGSNNLTATWKRRSRFSAQMLWTPILGEAEERYEIDIIDAAAVVNTYTVTSPTFVYSAAEQTDDGLTPGDPVEMRIYQMSAVVGRGYVLEVTL